MGIFENIPNNSRKLKHIHIYDLFRTKYKINLRYLSGFENLSNKLFL